VTVDDALSSGEAHAGSKEILRAVESLKWSEELRRVRHVEARAIVPNEERAKRRGSAPMLSLIRSAEVIACTQSAIDMRLESSPVGGRQQASRLEVRAFAHTPCASAREWSDAARAPCPGSVAEALSVMQRECPDVVVSDIGLPEEDG